MTDETKATAPESAENVAAMADPEQVRAEAERAAKEVAERKARSLDFMENYRDNQKAEKEERAKRAAASNSARARAAEEKRLQEEAERAAREEARRKEKEEFEARAKRNAAMLNEISVEEAKQKEEEAAAARLSTEKKPAVKEAAPVAPAPKAEPTRPAPTVKESAKPSFAMPSVTEFFTDSTVDSDALLSEVTVDGVRLGEGAADGVVVTGMSSSAEDTDDLASLIDVQIDLPEEEKEEKEPVEQAEETAEDAPTASEATPGVAIPSFPTPDDYIKAWQAAYGTDAASYDEQMKSWWQNYGGAMYGMAPNAGAQPYANAGFFAVQNAPASSQAPVDTETEKAVEETVKETAADVAEEEKIIASASDLDPLASYLKEQSEKISERRAARAKTKLPDKLDIQVEICNLYFEALAEIYRQNGKKFRKLYRDGAKREINIYNDMLRKYLRKNSGSIAFIPVDPTIPNRLLKGENPEPLFVKPLQREDAAQRKDKIFDDIEKMEGVNASDDFAKWIAEQEAQIREKKAGFKAASLADKIAIEESVCRILFEILRQISAQNKKAYAAGYRDKAKKEIAVYNDLVRKAGNPKKTGLVLVASDVPDRLLKGEDFDPFVKNGLQKSASEKKKPEDDAFAKYLADKNAKIREAKATFELSDAETRILLERDVCSHYFDILEQIRIHKKKAYASTYKNRALAEIALYNSLVRKAGKWYDGDRTQIAKTVPDKILRGEMNNPFRKRGEGAADESLALLADAEVSPEEKRHNDEAYLKAKEKYEISRREKCYYNVGLSFFFRARKDQKKAKRRMKKEIRAMKKRVKPVEEVEAYLNAKYLDLTSDTKPAARRRANAIMLRKLRDRISDLLAERDRINRRLIELYEYDAWKPAALGKKGLKAYLQERNTAFRKMKKTADRVQRMRIDPADRNDIYRLMDRVTELQAELRSEKRLRSKKSADRMQAQMREAALAEELSMAEDRLAEKLRHAETDRREKRKEGRSLAFANVLTVITLITVLGVVAFIVLRELGIL